jgi:N-acetylmuramoyl-L-alanine amidase
VKTGGRDYYLKGVLRDGLYMVPANDIASLFGLNARYESSINTVSLYRSGNPSGAQLKKIISSSDRYDPEDIYWLSRIVEAEAKGENYGSRLAVANVVLNRKNSGQYPDTVKAVIFDRKHGIQFTPASNGTVYNTPSPLSFLAALDALDGYNNVPGVLFFMNPSQAQTLWIENNRQAAFTMGAHTYYY